MDKLKSKLRNRYSSKFLTSTIMKERIKATSKVGTAIF